MGNYVERNLIADEQVVYETRIHPVIFLSPGAVIVLGIGLGVGLSPPAWWSWRSAR